MKVVALGSQILSFGWLVLVALPTLALPAGGTGPVQPSPEEDLSHRMVWHQGWDGQPIATFVPRGVMERTALESLPLDKSARVGLRRQTTDSRELRASLKANRGIELPECELPPGGPPMSVSEELGTPLDEWITTRDELSVLGSVVAVVDGWITATNQAAQLVYVQVDSVLYNDGERHVAEGALVSFLQYAGDFEVYGERICTQPYPDQYLAREGDMLLLSGTPRPHDTIAMSASVVFPVLERMIYPVPNGNVPWTEPFPISELRDGIAARARSDS